MLMKILKKPVLLLLILVFAFFHTSPLLLHASSPKVENDHLALWFSSPVKEQSTSMTFHFDFEYDIEVTCFFLNISFPKNTFLFHDDKSSFLFSDLLPYLRINGESIDENDSILGRLTKHYFEISNHIHLSRQNYLQLTLTEEFGLMFNESGLIPFQINLGVVFNDDTAPQKISIDQPNQVRVFEHLP